MTKSSSTRRHCYIEGKQFSFPFRPPQTPCDPNVDLVGCFYEDGDATIVVIETCLNDQSRVIVERDLDGHTWSMPAWLMRLVFQKTSIKRAA